MAHPTTIDRYTAIHRPNPANPPNVFIPSETTPARMADLIVKAAVKEQLAGNNVSSDFYDELDTEVRDILDEAAERAEENDRKTVQARDL